MLSTLARENSRHFVMPPLVSTGKWNQMNGGLAKCRLFSQVNLWPSQWWTLFSSNWTFKNVGFLEEKGKTWVPWERFREEKQHQGLKWRRCQYLNPYVSNPSSSGHQNCRWEANAPTTNHTLPFPPGRDLNSCMFSSLYFSFYRLKRILLINSNCAAGLAACLGNMTQLFRDWMADPVNNPWVLSCFNHSNKPRVYSLHIIDNVNM